jgi:predicted Zn-dependent protease
VTPYQLLSTFAVLVFAGLACGTSCAQNADAPAQQQNRFEAAANVEANNQAMQQQAKETIEKAIAVLVPGGIVDGTQRQKDFATVIDSFAKGQAKDALEALRTMAAEDRDLPPAEVMLAGLTFAVGDNKSGLALLESCAMKNPDYPGVYLSFAQIALNANRVTDASLHAAKTADLLVKGELTPNQKAHFYKQYYEIATGIYLRRKQPQKANEMLDELQKIAPNRPFYFFTKAEIAFRNGNNNEALQFLQQHASAIKGKRLPELTLTEWLKNSGKSEQAEQLLAETLVKNPADAQTQLMSAQMFMAKEDFPRALANLKKFEEIKQEETIQSLDMKGRIAFAGLSYEIASEHFLKLTKLAPNDPSSANIYALCLVESEDIEKRKQAQAISQRVATRMSSNSLALASLGYIYLKNGEEEKAAQILQRVALSRQGSPEISFFLANWLESKGDKDQAIGLLQKAVESQGLFLYRSAALKLQNRLKGQ